MYNIQKYLLHILGIVALVMLFQGCAGEITTYNLAKEGSEAYNASDYPTALEKWQAGLEQARTSENKKDEGMFLHNIGLVYDRMSHYQDALDYYQHALEIRRETKDKRGEGNTLNNIGIVYDKLGHYQEALDYYQQALTLRRKTGDKAGEGKNLNNIGAVYQHLGHYRDALNAYQHALTIRRTLGDRAGEGNTLNNLGTLFWIQGRYQDALDRYQHALAIRHEIGDKAGEGSTLNNIGVLYWNLGLYQQSLEYYQQALTIRQELGNTRGEASNLNNIGVVYWKLNDYSQALDYYHQALTIRREIGDKRGEANTLNNIGKVYEKQTHYDQALGYYQQALRISSGIGDKRGEANTLNNLGGIHRLLEQYQEAYSIFQSSVGLNETLGTLDGLWMAQSGLAAVEARLNQPEPAIIHYEQALETIESLRAGLTEKEHKISFIQDKLYVYDELILLLQTLHQKYPEKGYDRKALEIFERKQGRIFLEEMGKSGARLFAGLPETLKDQEDELVSRLEQLRQHVTDERAKATPDYKYLRTLEQQEKTLQTEQERLKVTLKTEYPDYSALRYPQPVDLVELQTTILSPGEMMLVYGVMQDQTLLWVIQPETLRMHALPVGEQVLQEEITQFRETLRFEWGTRRGLVMPGKSDKPFEQPEKKRLNAVERSHTLYTWLIPEELRDVIPEQRSLNIIPTGPLYTFPFEALVTSPPTPLLEGEGSKLPLPLGEGRGEGENAQELPGVRFLIEDIPMNYLSSASLLKTLREAKTRRTASARCPLLAFAHPVYTQNPSSESGTVRSLSSQAYQKLLANGLSELPETAEEAEAVAEVFEALEETTPLQLREEASRANLFAFNTDQRLADYQYLLFAMHGVMPGEVKHLTQSALILSDDFLTMADVFSLQLNAKLVALSACNTGRGRQIRGEGVMGLTRAFMYAGTPAIAVTLWSVESLSAKTLSIGMFRNLKDGLSPARALRTIKMRMLRGEEGQDYQHPYYWAPFVMFGDGQ